MDLNFNTQVLVNLCLVNIFFLADEHGGVLQEKLN